MLTHMYNMEAIQLLSVSQEQMGQPYVNMFSSYQTDSLCCSKHPLKSVGIWACWRFHLEFIWISLIAELVFPFRMQAIKKKKEKIRQPIHPSTWPIQDKTYSDYCSWRLTSNRSLLILETFILSTLQSSADDGFSRLQGLLRQCFENIARQASC